MENKLLVQAGSGTCARWDPWCGWWEQYLWDVVAVFTISIPALIMKEFMKGTMEFLLDEELE